MRHFLVRTMLGVSISLAATTSHANSGVKEIFDSYAQTRPHYTQDLQEGMYLSGGSFSGRIQQKNVSLARFTPPSISAGCNGVDIFAGSFGLISGDEIVQVARGVAQGSAPYFFQLALQSICPACKDISDSIQKMISDMNKFGRNSCEQSMEWLAKETDFSNKVTKWAENQGVLIDQDSGIADFFGVKKTTKEDSSDQKLSEATRKKIEHNVLTHFVSSSYPTMEMIGIVDKNASDAEKRKQALEFVMSLVGTVIVHAKSKDECDAAVDGGEQCFSYEPVEPVLTLQTIYEGAVSSGGDTGIRRCVGSTNGLVGAAGTEAYENEKLKMQCMSVTREEAPDELKVGFKPYYEAIINGDGGDFPLGIFEVAHTKSDDSLKEEQKNFKRVVRYSWTRAAREYDKNQLKDLGTMLASQLAREHAVRLAMDALVVLYHAIAYVKQDSSQPVDIQSIVRLKDNFEAKFINFKDNLDKKNRATHDRASHAAALLTMTRKNLSR